MQRLCIFVLLLTFVPAGVTSPQGAPGDTCSLLNNCYECLSNADCFAAFLPWFTCLSTTNMQAFKRVAPTTFSLPCCQFSFYSGNTTDKECYHLPSESGFITETWMIATLGIVAVIAVIGITITFWWIRQRFFSNRTETMGTSVTPGVPLDSYPNPSFMTPASTENFASVGRRGPPPPPPKPARSTFASYLPATPPVASTSSSPVQERVSLSTPVRDMRRIFEN